MKSAIGYVNSTPIGGPLFVKANAPRRLWAERFGPAAHVKRLQDLIGRPRRAVRGASIARGRRHILFFTSNGVGIGHLTRMLAVARRCPTPLQPVFLTFPRRSGSCASRDFWSSICLFTPRSAATSSMWNKSLREELNELIGFYDPPVLLFDGHVPYQGLVDSLADNPDLLSVWCRRGMWQPGRGQDAIARERHFDAVVEPGDLAGDFDRGLTLQSRSRTRVIDPIRLLDAGDLLSPDAARAALSIDPSRPAVLLQLGAGNNYDYATLRRAAIALLRERYDADVRVAEWPIADRPVELPDGVGILKEYPLSRYLRAFDLVISAAGYNSFHELLLAGVPAIFVPNEHPQQDDQLARARFAEHRGVGACVRVREIYRLSACVERLLQPDERHRIAERCAALDQSNGAVELASFIEEMAYSRRVDRP